MNPRCKHGEEHNLADDFRAPIMVVCKLTGEECADVEECDDYLEGEE